MLIFSPTATADLSCQVQRTTSLPVTGQPQCSGSNTQLCTSERILCSCFGEGAAIEWQNTLFSRNLDFTNTGSTMVGARETDPTTGASAVVTAVNPLVNITTDLTLNVTTTAAVNAMEFNNTAIGCQDASGPPGRMEQTILIYGRFMCVICEEIHIYVYVRTLPEPLKAITRESYFVVRPCTIYYTFSND